MIAQDVPMPASKLNRATAGTANRQSALTWPDQERRAVDKLAAFLAPASRRPDIVIIIFDDVGYRDPGSFGAARPSGRQLPSWLE